MAISPPDHKQIIRREVLLLLYGAGQTLSLTMDYITRSLTHQGIDTSGLEVHEALHYWNGLGAVEQVLFPSGQRRWRITTRGIQLWESGEV